MMGDVTNFKLSKDGKTGLVNKNPDVRLSFSLLSSLSHLLPLPLSPFFLSFLADPPSFARIVFAFTRTSNSGPLNPRNLTSSVDCQVTLRASSTSGVVSLDLMTIWLSRGVRVSWSFPLLALELVVSSSRTDASFPLSFPPDSNVYVWHRQTGELLEVLSGHTRGVVNAVAWRPDVAGEDGAMFASCGDDGEM